MSEQNNIQIVRKLYDNLNKHNLESTNQLFSDDLRSQATGVPSVLKSREQGQAYVRQFLDAFPDMHFDIRDIIAQGDKVAVSWTSSGTHERALTTMDGNRLPATHKKGTVMGCSFYELRNNLITRQEICWDQMSLFSQLGVPLDMIHATAAR